MTTASGTVMVQWAGRLRWRLMSFPQTCWRAWIPCRSMGLPLSSAPGTPTTPWGWGSLSLRDMGKIDKWNNVAPVDLTRDGVRWFTSLNDSIAGFLNNPTGDVAFGQALSIGGRPGRRGERDPVHLQPRDLRSALLRLHRLSDPLLAQPPAVDQLPRRAHRAAGGHEQGLVPFLAAPLRRDDPLRPCTKMPPPGVGSGVIFWGWVTAAAGS